MVHLWFSINRDYREGVHIECKRKEFDDAEADFEFELPTNRFRLYVVKLSLHGNDDIIYQHDCKNTKEYMNWVHKIFSQVHNSLPFTVTGMTTGHVDEGDYPEIPEHIKNMQHIEEIDKINNNDNETRYDRYFIVVLNSKGKDLHIEPLMPIF